MSQKTNIIYAVSSGILLSLPWFAGLTGTFLFIAFVPLLLLEDDYYRLPSQKPHKKIFLFASLTFFVWNALSTLWIANASLAGAITAITVNTFLFSLVFGLFHATRKIMGTAIGYLALVFYWTAFEYLYLNAEISWPWLNLGNGFFNSPKLIQWYEFTGTLGGTFWVLAANIMLVQVLKKALSGEKVRAMYFLGGFLGIVALPLVYSIYTYNNYSEEVNECNIAVIQPGFNPYHPPAANIQCNNLMRLADSIAPQPVDFILAPEGILDDNIWEDSLDNNFSLFTLRNFMAKHPKNTLVLGAFTYKSYPPGVELTATARLLKAPNQYFDSFNSAMQINSNGDIAIYHKSKLVVGIEKAPYPKLLGFMKKPLEYFGGSYVSYGTQATRNVFVSASQKAKLAPVICYESVYGEFVTGYVKNGANIIGILTNDGWWGNTSGYVHHFGYARLRAIETRRCIARAASTGISGFINQRGDIISTTQWNRQTALNSTLNLNNTQTFYVKQGDYLGRWAALLSGIIISFAAIWYFFRKNRKFN